MTTNEDTPEPGWVAAWHRALEIQDALRAETTRNPLAPVTITPRYPVDRQLALALKDSIETPACPETGFCQRHQRAGSHSLTGKVYQDA